VSIARWNPKGLREKYRAVIKGDKPPDEPVGQRWGKVESALLRRRVLIHPPHQGVCGRHGTEEQRVTSGELAESRVAPGKRTYKAKAKR